jgi:hypothetical protein
MRLRTSCNSALRHATKKSTKAATKFGTKWKTKFKRKPWGMKNGFGRAVSRILSAGACRHAPGRESFV